MANQESQGPVYHLTTAATIFHSFEVQVEQGTVIQLPSLKALVKYKFPQHVNAAIYIEGAIIHYKEFFACDTINRVEI